MKSLKLTDILSATCGTLLCGDINNEITDISTDSRNIGSNSLFVPLIGEKFDGHNFIGDVIEKGAVAVLTSKDEISSSKKTAIIKVDDTSKALGKIAGLYKSMFDIPALSITGSVGKTTTKELCACVLSKKYNVLKNKGNFNNEIGVPLTLFGLCDDHEFLISEMGMSGFGEIDRISQMVKPDAVIMTNIGMSHIELLGSQENIYKAKSEFVKNMNPDGVVIINGDDDILLSHRDELGKNVITVGINNKNCDIVAENIKSLTDSVTFIVKTKTDSFDVLIPVPGEHNVYNALCAIAVGRYFGVENEKISAGLGEFVPDKMRMCTIEHEKYTIINDCYNAAPDSCAAALKVLGKKTQRKVAVLGDIACLGDYSEDAHKFVGSEVVKNGVDVLVTIGTEAKTVAKSAVANGMKGEFVNSFDSVDDALLKINEIIKEGDIILVKASRVMELEKVTEFLTK